MMKKNIDKQKAVVTAIWDFIEKQQDTKHDITQASFYGTHEVSANQDAVGEVVEKIMKIFDNETALRKIVNRLR